MTKAIVIFAFTYVLIAARRLRWLPIGRPAGALVGASLTVMFGVLRPGQTSNVIDHSTLGLLFGMMLINAHLERAGAFRLLAQHLKTWPDSPRVLLCLVAFGAGVGAALVVNDAICLMGTPVIMAVCRERKLRPLPFLLALAIGSNVGGVMTLTGTPQCMIIGQLGHLSYVSYLAVMGPIGLVNLGILCVILLLAFRDKLHPVKEFEQGSRESMDHFDHGLLRPSLIAVLVVTIGFFLRFDLAWTAVAGATLLLVLARRDAQRVLVLVDWSVLLFFTGLFIVVGGLKQSGAVDRFMSVFTPFLSRGEGAVFPFAFVSVIGSNVISNVPFVLVVGPSVDHLSHARLMWFVLSMASTFAGNLTLLGSVANILVSEESGEEGEMTFMNYLRVGLPTTLVTVTVGAVMLLLFFRFGVITATSGW